MISVGGQNSHLVSLSQGRKLYLRLLPSDHALTFVISQVQ